MTYRRLVCSFFIGSFLLGSLAASRSAEASGVKKATQQADKAIIGTVREAGKAFKKASQEIDKAAKTGSDGVRQAVKGRR